MKIEHFSEFKTGRLVPITNYRGYPDWAFIPQALPPAITMTNTLWSLLNEATRKVERLNGLGSGLPSPSLLLRPLQRREALTSNSLEGTFVSPRELLLFEVEKSATPTGADPAESTDARRGDWIEVANYDRALQRGSAELRSGRPLDIALLCELHSLLLRGARGRHKNPGIVRDSQVYVGVSGRYIPPPVSELDAALANWASYLTETNDVDPLIRAYIAHYQFEAIHPFMDGNGRIGRLWLSLTLQRWLSHSQAWLYMSEFFEKHRKDYIERLFRISTHGEWAEWIEFCLIGTREQAETSIARCERLNALKADYLQRVKGGRSRDIIELLFDNPFIDAPRLTRLLGVSQPTARSDIMELEQAGILTHITETKSPRVFVAMNIFHTAYDREPS